MVTTITTSLSPLFEIFSVPGPRGPERCTTSPFVARAPITAGAFGAAGTEIAPNFTPLPTDFCTLCASSANAVRTPALAWYSRTAGDLGKPQLVFVDPALARFALTLPA